MKSKIEFISMIKYLTKIVQNWDFQVIDYQSIMKSAPRESPEVAQRQPRGTPEYLQYSYNTTAVQLRNPPTEIYINQGKIEWNKIKGHT